MATKKRNKKIKSKSREARGKKAPSKKVSKKSGTSLKKLNKNTRSARKGRARTKRSASGKQRSRTRRPRTGAGSAGKSEQVSSVVFEPKGLGAPSAGQSGDLQGISDIDGADSESVGELLEEGNAFEAEVVKGVQDAPDADQGEIRTHGAREDRDPDED